MLQTLRKSVSFTFKRKTAKKLIDFFTVSHSNDHRFNSQREDYLNTHLYHAYLLLAVVSCLTAISKL